ncbi:MAG: tRNA (N6-threonylcarbamoyladenosine(37)-N6)-methyltransferase TrmO [Bryobacteraceae bacterium]
MVLRPIGVVRSGVKERRAIPSHGAPAAIELLPQFAPGLLHIEKHSHVWIMAWLDGAERDVLQVIPRGAADRGPSGLHGVFATRSPARPNPIGLTAARVLHVDGLRIEVDRLDFSDGTPILDLKPYFTTRDMIFSATNRAVGRPVNAEALREALLMQAENYHGKLCADLALAVRIVEHFRTRFYALEEPPQWHVAAPLSRPCLLDALIGMTRVSSGRGTLRLWGRDAVGFMQPESLLQYELATVDPDMDYARILAAPERALFTFWPAPQIT